MPLLRPISVALALLVTATGVAATRADELPPGVRPSGQSGGISLEAHTRLYPPQPLAVMVVRSGDQAVISWQTPADPRWAAPLNYDPEIKTYRVYRIGPRQRRDIVGETRATTLRVDLPDGGRSRRYGVTAVQTSGQESPMSEIVKLRLR